MRRRMYFVLPDVPTAEQTTNDLLLARIDERHLHRLGRCGTPLGKLREAGVLQKTDLAHGAQVAYRWWRMRGTSRLCIGVRPNCRPGHAATGGDPAFFARQHRLWCPGIKPHCLVHAKFAPENV